MSTRLPFSAQRATALPASQVGGIINPIIIGPPIGAPGRPGSDASRTAAIASLGPLGLLIGADLDFVDVALRIGAGIIGVAFIVAGGFLLVKEYETSTIAKAVGGAIGGK